MFQVLEEERGGRRAKNSLLFNDRPLVRAVKLACLPAPAGGTQLRERKTKKRIISFAFNLIPTL